MRVLYVIPGTPEGNEFIFAKRQIACIEASGIVTKKFFLTSRTSISYLASAICCLKDEIRGFRPDLVHAQFGTTTAVVCVCAGANPLIVTFRGGDLNPTREVSRIRSLAGRLMSQIAALRATAIICVAPKLKSRLWWKKRRSLVIPNGLDLSLFCPISKADARIALGWRPADRVVLFNAGRNARAKRLDLALASVERARLQVADLHLEILRGETAPTMVPLYLNAADCLIVTSDWEGSPNIVKEALACNLPVVSVDVGDVPERLAGVHPSCIAERNSEALGRCVAEIVQEDRRSNGRDRIAHLSEKKVAEQILEVYRQVLFASKGGTVPVSQPSIPEPSQNQ